MTLEAIPTQRRAPEASLVICTGNTLLRLEQRNGAALPLGTLVLQTDTPSEVLSHNPDATATTADPNNSPAATDATEESPEHATDPTQAEPTPDAWMLVKEVQAGNRQAFADIYHRYMDTIFRFIYFRVGNRHVAEDLAADTFLRALGRIDTVVERDRDLGAWLVTIARNLVADYFKSGRYRFEFATGEVADDNRVDPYSPEQLVTDYLTNLTLIKAVQKLNPEQRECIILRFLMGFSVAETAQAMGKNTDSIRAMQYRAVRALRGYLPEDYEP